MPTPCRKRFFIRLAHRYFEVFCATTNCGASRVGTSPIPWHRGQSEPLELVPLPRHTGQRSLAGLRGLLIYLYCVIPRPPAAGTGNWKRETAPRSRAPRLLLRPALVFLGASS